MSFTMSWLTGYDLEALIKKHGDEMTKKAFMGVYAMDKLPQRILQLPALFIVNTHSMNLPGQHWIAVYIDTQRHAEVFDSLATPLSEYLLRWLRSFSTSFKRSVLTLQNPVSASCGAFVLYYILQRVHVKNMEVITSSFSPNVIHNDRVMLDYVKLLRK